MFIKICVMSMCIFLAQIPVVFCQSLDGSPYDPERDSNIDMFMGNWKDSIPKDTHGSLIERDILTKGDALNPPRKGAVLEYVNRFTHGTLSSNSTTASTVLKGEQEIFYILSGRGLVKAGETKSELFEGICFFIPENLEFTITNTGGDDLTMYIISEPAPEGFTPRKDMLVKNEHLIPFSRTVGHWSYQEKDFMLKGDGLATIYGVCTITLDPMTIGHPHFHTKGTEEVWTTISGDNIAFLGKQIRHQPPGTAYMIPPDGKTNHSNINQSKTEQVKMLYFSVRKDIEK